MCILVISQDIMKLVGMFRFQIFSQKIPIFSLGSIPQPLTPNYKPQSYQPPPNAYQPPPLSRNYGRSVQHQQPQNYVPARNLFNFGSMNGDCTLPRTTNPLRPQMPRAQNSQQRFPSFAEFLPILFVSCFLCCCPHFALIETQTVMV